MNMAKLGIVSVAINGFNGCNFSSKINKMRETSYTLCVFDLGANWNSLRYGFGFNIPQLTRTKATFPWADYRYRNGNFVAPLFRYCNEIILRIASRGKFGKRSAAFPPDAKTRLSGSYVIPGQSLMDETKKLSKNHHQTLTECGLRPDSPPKNNCSSFATCPRGGFLVANRQASQIFEPASAAQRKQLGSSGLNFGRIGEGQKPKATYPPAKPLLTLMLTAEQLGHLAFAVYSQVAELTEGREADSPEVQDAIRCLDEVSSMCIELEKRRLS